MGTHSRSSGRSRHRSRRGLRRLLSLRVLVLVLFLGGIGAVFAWLALREDADERFAREWSWAAKLRASGDADKALPLLLRLREQRPGVARLGVQTAECLRRLGQDDRAREVLSEVLEYRPRYRRAHALLATMSFEEEDWAAAREHARLAFKAGADDFQLRFTAGLAAYRMGLNEEARREFRAALSHSPGHAAVKAFLAATTPSEGNPFSTLSDVDVQRLRELSQAGEMPLARYAGLLLSVGRRSEALKAVRDALAKSPSDPEIVTVALLVLGPEDEEEAGLLFESVPEPGPDLRLAWARRLARMGRHDEALQALGEDDSSEGALARARIHRLSRRPEEALGAVTGVPETPETHAVRVLALCDLGRRDEALEALEAAREQWPGRPDILLTDADAILLEMEESGDPDPDLASRVLEILSGKAEAEPAFVAAQARAALIGGDTARARELLEGLPELGDAEPAVRRARILLAIRDGDLVEALGRVRSAGTGVRSGLLRSVATLALRRDRAEDALALMEASGARPGPGWTPIRVQALLDLSRGGEALALLGDSSRATRPILLARALRASGRSEDAERLLREVIEEAPSSVPARSLLAYWLILEEKGDEAAVLVLADDAAKKALGALAILLERAGRRVLAARWLGKARERWPDDRGILARLALIEIRSGPMRPEAKAWQREIEAVARSSEVPHLGLIRGYFAYADGDDDAALAAARAAIAADPELADAHLLAGFVHLRRSDTVRARKRLETVVGLGPGRDVAKGLLAYLVVLEANGMVRGRDLRGAEDALARASELGSRGRVYQLAKARLTIAQGDYEAGRKALKAIGLVGAVDLLTLAEELGSREAEGDLEGALAVAGSLCESRPESPFAWLHRGRLAGRLGREEALGFLEKAYRLAPDWGGALVALCRALLEDDRPKDADRVLLDHLERAPKDAFALALLGEVRLARDDLRSARAYAERAIRVGGAGAFAREVLVRTLHRLVGPEAAVEAALAGVEGAKADARDQSLAGRTLLLAGRPNRARPYLENAVAAQPGLLAAQCALAEVLLLEGRAVRALPHVEKAVELDPGGAGTLFLLGSVQETLDRTAEARATYESVLVLEPRHPLAQMNLARLLADSGGTERALDLSAQALAGLPGVPEAEYARGFVLYRAGRPKVALPHLRAGVSDESRPEDRAILAFALHDAGENEEALALLEALRRQVQGELNREVVRRLAGLR